MCMTRPYYISFVIDDIYLEVIMHNVIYFSCFYGLHKYNSKDYCPIRNKIFTIVLDGNDDKSIINKLLSN